MRRVIPMLALALLWGHALGAAPPAAAEPGHGGFGPPHGPPPGALIDFHAEELGLDESTQEEIRSIIAVSRAEGQALDEEIRSERRALHALMEADPVDREAVMTQVQVVGDLKTAAEKHRIDAMLSIRQQLSPEQRAGLLGMRDRMRRGHLAPILDACAEETESLCDARGPRAMHCLLRQRDQVSEPCAAALDGLPRGFGKGHRRGPPGRHRRGEPPPWGPAGPDAGIE